MRKTQYRPCIYVLTRCSACGTESANQRPGDGCHACGRGFMRLA